MVRDRLPDLFARRRQDRIGRGFLPDIFTRMSQNLRVQNILDDAGKIRRMLDLLQDNVNIVKNMHANNLSHINTDIQTTLESQTFIITQIAFQIRNELDKIGKSLPKTDVLSLECGRVGPIHERVRTLQYLTMLRTFSIIMCSYNESLMRYHAKCSSILQHQKQILRKESIGVSAVDDHEDDDQRSNLFIGNFLEDTKEAIHQLSELQSRHADLIKLEKSLVEIRDMFSELAFSVEKQGDQVNCVEYFAGQASDQVDNGRYTISRAEKTRNRNRKRNIKCLSFLTVVILILLIIIIFL